MTSSLSNLNYNGELNQFSVGNTKTYMNELYSHRSNQVQKNIFE